MPQVALWKNTPQVDLESKLCSKWAKVCAKPTPALAERKFDEPFKGKSTKDLEMEKLMASMQGMPGMGGMSMMSKDDMLEGMGGDEEDL